MDGSSDRRPARRRRRIARALAGALLVGAVALALGVATRRELAERWLLGELAQRGAVPAELHVTRLGPGGLALEGVAIGSPDAPDLTLAALDASWSLAGLRARRLDALALSGLHLRGAQRDGGLDFGAAAALWRGRDGDGAPPVLPARRIALRDVSLELATPQGVASGTLAGELGAGPDGSLSGELQLALAHPVAQAQGKVALSGTLAALAGQLDLELRDAREPARVAPARLRGQLSGASHDLRFDLSLEGAKGALRAQADGHADLGARDAEARFRVEPIAFAAGALQPAALVPALELWLTRSEVEQVSGRVEAQGTLALSQGKPGYRLALTLRDVGFDSRLGRVSGLAGGLALRGPPLSTPAGQELHVARFEAGVPFTDGVLAFQLVGPRVLRLSRTSWHFAGGELRADDLAFELGAERNEARMLAVGLDLGALLELVSLEGVGGSGRVDGELPFVRREGAWRVEQGVLRAAAGGTIRYQPNATVAKAAASRPNDLGMALEVLSDFHYDALEADIDGELAGELHVELHLRGKNPGFRGGYPIELNLALDGPLADVARSGEAVYHVPRGLAERLRRLTVEEKP
jgi:hypothetical protein